MISDRERERLAARLLENARPGEGGDRECCLAHALRYGSATVSDDDVIAAARRRLGENVAADGSGGTVHAAADDARPTSTLTDFTAITARRRKWAWKERIARGKITGLSGKPKIGKGLLYSHLAAKVTRGDPHDANARHGGDTSPGAAQAKIGPTWGYSAISAARSSESRGCSSPAAPAA